MRPFLLAVLAMVLLLPARAVAAPPFPITESFTKSSMEPGWQLGGSAALTAPQDGENNGWLRLTSTSMNQFGYVFNDVAFPTTNGVLAEFDYATYGGDGADGLVFFLYDGATPANEFQAGPAGGSLGYSHCPATSSPGLNNAYLGVGLDEWGNFSLGSFCNQGGEPGSSLLKDRVTVRAGEGASPAYGILATQVTSQSLIADRTQSRHVTVSINDGKLQTYIEYPNGEIQTVASDVSLPANPPSTLKLGFIASTGGSHNYHEIRNTKVVEPVDLVTTVTDGKAGDTRGATHTWTATVTNDGPNATTAATVQATSDMAGLADVSWTCAGTASACPVASGTGLPSTTTSLNDNESATYTITAKSSSPTDFGTLRVEAQPTGDTGELDPLDNATTDLTDLTPVNDVLPTISWNGTTASRTSNGTWRGGSLVPTYDWLVCEPDGTACVSSGQTGTTWNPTSAVTGKTLRLAVTATNAAGATTARSEPITLPTTAVTAGPASVVSTASASVTFTHDGTSAQCRLDGGAWTTCTSPWSGTVSRGSHTLEVRGHRGVLADASPATRSWTVDDETGVALTAPLSGLTADSTPEVAFTGTEAGTYVVTIDGTSVGTGTLDGAFKGTVTPASPLADGAHAAKVVVTDAVGNTNHDTVVFTVDTTAPDPPVLEGAPKPKTKDRLHVITWTPEPGAGSRCRLDGGAWKACASPWDVTGLPDGEHVLEVDQTDLVGNRSKPATVPWTQDTTPPAPPAVSLPTGTPTKPGSGGPREVSWRSEDGSTSRCRINGGEWQACVSPMVLPDLGAGEHAFEVEVLDALGNLSERAETRWTVAAPAAPAPTCASRRAVDLHWTVARGSRVKQFRVRVDGKLVAKLGRWSRSYRAVLAGRPRGTVRVAIAAYDVRGRKVGTARTYRTCKGKVEGVLPTIRLGAFR